ncbi:ATP-dependent RNA helicase rok1 [Geopyxis carbonaria]|nr:ATP-dependent RNA helicase rok1 [Geopyxis carbonaria]
MSDVFRLLTRSATFTKRAPSNAATASKPVAAPVEEKLTKSQLRRKKRKMASGESGEVEIPEELDFFKAKRVKVEGEGSDGEAEKGKGGKKVKREKKDEKKEEEGEEVRLPTDEETRAVLRKNKLKFTLLTATSEPEPAPEPETKKSKKSKKTAAAAPAEEPKKKKKPELLIPPLTSFAHLRSQAHGYALSKRVYANLLAQGYTTPTQVQMGALPVLMSRTLNIPGLPEDAGAVNLLCCAPTGSGKTLAYAVPLLNALLAERSALKEGAHGEGEGEGEKEGRGKGREKEKGVRAVVLAPTKELVAQIVNEIRKLAEGTGIRVAGMRKGMRPVSVPSSAEAETAEPEPTESAETSDSEAEDTAAAPKPAAADAVIKSSIIVSTPLVLLHALTTSPSPLRGLHTLILDEADILLDAQFRPQTLGVLQHLQPHSRTLQTSLWSATIPSSTEALAAASLSAAPLLRLVVGLKDTALPTIPQALLYTASERGKLLALRQLFTTSLRPPILIFVQSVARAQALTSELMYDLPTPGRIAVLHADLPDDQRAAAMARFRKGDTWVLITTDLLARGIDFAGVRVVVNYDIPTSVAAYIHRVGRTGRGGREGGEAVTYYTKEDIKYVKGIAQVIAASTTNTAAAVGSVPKWLLDSLPAVGKNARKELKLHGVRERQGREGRISTKSGFQRKQEGNRKGAVEASRRRKVEGDKEGSDGEGEGEGGKVSDYPPLDKKWSMCIPKYISP